MHEEHLVELEGENQRLRELLARVNRLKTETRRLGEHLLGAGDGLPSRKTRTFKDLIGVSDIETGISSGLTSIPRGDNRYYLDLYLLQKEWERLTQEGTWMDKRRRRMGRRMGFIIQQMSEKEEKARQSMELLWGKPMASRAEPREKENDNRQPKGPGWSRQTIEY